MNECITISEAVRQQFTARATLVGLGVKVRRLAVMKPVAEQVQIAQKTVKYTPLEKLTDALIAILAGAHGLVEVNKRVRADGALQCGFGRRGCAEQSVVQDTLDACTSANVLQMQKALDQIYRRWSQGYRHNYGERCQLLDIDTTGRPCGKKAALATRGYFAHRPHRRGRQVGYVLATWYEELVVTRLYSGATQLVVALPALVEAAEATLELTSAQREQTILRIDSGGGTVEDLNWVFARGYQVHGKDYAAPRAAKLAATVQHWVDDPHNLGRQVAWVEEETQLYCRPVRRIAVRCPRKNGTWASGVIISTLSPAQVLALTGQAEERSQDPLAVLLAYVYFYDQRGGGVETEIKEDKQGLATAHRNKKRFEGQQVLGQLELFAHNLLVWARRWLAPACPKIAHWGLLRLVRDVLQTNGVIWIDPSGEVRQIILNAADPLAVDLQRGFSALLAEEQIAVISGEI
jgi:hypothetical protein